MQNVMHWREPARVLDGLHLALKPSGKVWILQADPDLPIPEGWIKKSFGWPTDAVLRARWGRYRPSPEGLGAIPGWLEEAGFGEIEIGCIGFYRSWSAIKS